MGIINQNPLQNFTVSFWFVPMRWGGDQTLISVGTYLNILVGHTSTGYVKLGTLSGSGAWRELTSTDTAGYDGWSHVAVTVDDAGNSSLYLNGVFQGTQTGCQAIVPNADYFKINSAGRTDSTYLYQAIYDEVQIDSAVWSAAEILSYYNSTLSDHQVLYTP